MRQHAQFHSREPEPVSWINTKLGSCLTNEQPKIFDASVYEGNERQGLLKVDHLVQADYAQQLEACRSSQR